MENSTEFVVPEFALRCRAAAEDVWQASFAHPFLTELESGTLSLERFRFYQMQDARYLEAYADTCSLISARMNDPSDKLWFIEGARIALVVERELHTEYGRKLGYSSGDIAALALSADNRAYQNHLIATAQTGTLIEAVAALSPCPWLYADIGRVFERRRVDRRADHPFGAWLETYADPSFVKYTNELLEILERLANGVSDDGILAQAVDAFVTSSRYEFLFWEQAWNGQAGFCPGIHR